MIKLLPIFLICSLFSSCIKVTDGPYSDYRFEVSCDNCLIKIQSGFDFQSYHVRGFQSIPYNHTLPLITVSLWTDNNIDYTTVKFVGSGYNRIVFDDDLYYDDPAVVVDLRL
ncbi:hypothetical protein HDF26_000957 [Pedobacter cryoconitis]|uniref:Lipoprotein n=1 Tax=Pedobacter cryoconitis TaxID=188932 RepID=A0A7W8ZPB7_9SPHI|nr:hypothetical protein [Pedobacter cryoconitis]MBB5637713.1 hypothetical protein [Pedobacter cryoconitis]MBB6270530.1 hypothetical protein [Pedobacter cryoconitis]